MKEGKTAALVVEVIPLSKGAGKSSLTYFTTRSVLVGDFVKVPLRNKSIPAIVSAVHKASQAKTALKKESYSLKKIGKVSGEEPVARLPEHLLLAAERTAKYYATPLGSILRTIIPNILLEHRTLLWSRTVEKSKASTPTPQSEVLTIQLEVEDRYGQYKSIIRESLAKKNSIMFIVPTDLEAERAFGILAKGIEEYAYLFTLKRKLKEQKDAIKAIKKSDHPLLIVTTPAGSVLDRPDLGTIILERESSRAYRTLARPFISFKTFIENYALASKKRLLLGDSALSVETLWKEREGEYREFLPMSWRLSPASSTYLIDMKHYKPPVNKEDFSVLSPDLRELIQKALEENSGIFLFGARKGLAPTTICEDCGSVLSCKNCGAPVVLYTVGDKNIYICHACKARRPTSTLCDICTSWRLAPLGIGIDRIANEVHKLFPKSPFFILDKNHAPTDVKARSIAKEFKARGGILVGTELALLHVESVPYAGLVSADALFSVPDFGIHERIFYLVSRLREMAKKEVLIQTRNIGKQILAWASSGNVLDFYKEEVADREALKYPPFSIFIKITLPERSGQAGESIGEIKELFDRWHPDIVDNSLIMRLSRDEWPDEELLRVLALLTPDFLIKVDPESIL